MIPQGLCTFAGSESLLSANFTLTPGISPSVATLHIAPRPGRVPEQGPLLLTYGGTRIVFPDCRLMALSDQIDSQGRETWGLSVADRRWRWKYAGRISGRYNARGGTRGLKSEKSPRELARLCLVAMGEQRFNLSRLPNKARPEVDWDYALPAEALAQLCESLGCRVVLRLDNSVSLEPVGLGDRLPLGTEVLAASQAAEAATWPSGLVLVCGRTRWQHDFRLEAVGLEADGTLQPLNKLSYVPSGASSSRDWRNCDVPYFQNVSRPEARGLARQSVFRYYRIATPVSLPLLGGRRLEVDKLDRLLPLQAELVQAASSPSEHTPRPALVYGVFHGGNEATRSETTSAKPNVEQNPRGLFTGDYTLDRERGLVIFAEPVFRFFDAGSTAAERNLIAPADLWLRISVELRDADTGGWLRHEVERRGDPRAGGSPRYVRRDDLALTLIQNQTSPSAGRVADNRAAIEAEANRYLDALLAEQRLAGAASVTYAGLKPLEVDGAIAQVTWTISPTGFATTRASRNHEDASLGPTHKERRFVERLS